MTEDLKRIEQKLDMIISFFNVDGKHPLPVSIKKEAEERVIKILDRRNKKKAV